MRPSKVWSTVVLAAVAAAAALWLGRTREHVGSGEAADHEVLRSTGEPPGLAPSRSLHTRRADAVEAASAIPSPVTFGPDRGGTTRKITGRVVEAGTNTPVRDVEVRARDQDSYFEWGTGTRTDAQGRFVLDDIPRDYALRIRALRPGSRRASVALAAFGPDTDVVLEVGGGGVLKGHAHDKDGRGVEGVTVFVVPREDPDGVWGQDMEDWDCIQTTTDASGAYRIDGLPLGKSLVVAAHDETRALAQSPPTTFSEAGQVLVYDVAVLAPGAIRVRVQDEAGSPFPNFDVVLEGDLAWGVTNRSRDSANVSWTREGLTPGRYVLRVQPSRAAIVVREAEVLPRQTTDVLVVAKPLGREVLEGVVVDGAGRPVPGAAVSFSSPTSYVEGRSDARGCFRLEGLEGAPGVARAWQYNALGASSRAFPGVPATPGGASLTLVYLPASRVTGRIADVAPGDSFSVTTIGDDWMAGTSSIPVGDNGQFELPPMFAASPFLILFTRSGDGFPSFVEVGALDPGTTSDLGDLRWDAVRAAVATVVDDRGAPVVNARVGLIERWCWGERDMLRTDTAGRVLVERAPSSPFRVRIDAAGFPPQEATGGGGPEFPHFGR